MALFSHGSGLVTELPTLAVLMAHFGHYIANFDGLPSELPPGGSSDGTFLTVIELQTLAVLMALFSHADFLLKFPKYTVILSIFEPEMSSFF